MGHGPRDLGHEFIDDDEGDGDQQRHSRADALRRAALEEAEGAGREDGVWEEVHETAVNLLYVLIALHIAGVAFETRRSGREILLAMLPGRA